MPVELVIDDPGFGFGKVWVHILYSRFHFYVFVVGDFTPVGGIQITVNTAFDLSNLFCSGTVRIHFPELSFRQIRNSFAVRSPVGIRFIVIGIGNLGDFPVCQIHNIEVRIRTVFLFVEISYSIDSLASVQRDSGITDTTERPEYFRCHDVGTEFLFRRFITFPGFRIFFFIIASHK